MRWLLDKLFLLYAFLAALGIGILWIIGEQSQRSIK